MSVTLDLPAEAESRLTDAAKRSGKTLEQFATEVLVSVAEAEVETFDQILAPFRKQVAESGMTEAELDAFFGEVLEEVRAEQREKAK